MSINLAITATTAVTAAASATAPAAENLSSKDAEQIRLCRAKLSEKEADQNEFIIRAGYGHVERMQTLLERVDITARYRQLDPYVSYGYTRNRNALFCACYHNQPGAIKLVLDAAKSQGLTNRIINTRISAWDFAGNMPIHALFSNPCSKSTFDMLVQAGADTNADEREVNCRNNIRPLHRLLCHQVSSNEWNKTEEGNPITEDVLGIATTILEINSKRLAIIFPRVHEAISKFGVPKVLTSICVDYYGPYCPEIVNAGIQDGDNVGHTPLSLAALCSSTCVFFLASKEDEENEKRRVQLVKIMIDAGGDLSIKARIRNGHYDRGLQTLAHSWKQAQNKEIQQILKGASATLPPEVDPLAFLDKADIAKANDPAIEPPKKPSLCDRASACMQRACTFLQDAWSLYQAYQLG